MQYAVCLRICVWNCSDVYAYWRIWWKSVSSTRTGGVNTHKPSILQTALVVLAQHPPQHVSCVGLLCIASWTVGLQSQEAESQAPWNVPPQLASCDCLEVRTSGWQLTLGWLPVLFVSLCISLSHILNGRALPVDQRCLSRLCKTTLEVLKQVHIISCRHTSKLQTQKHSGRLTGLCASRVVSLLQGHRPRSTISVSPGLDCDGNRTISIALQFFVRHRSQKQPADCTSRTVSKSVVEFNGCPWPSDKCNSNHRVRMQYHAYKRKVRLREASSTAPSHAFLRDWPHRKLNTRIVWHLYQNEIAEHVCFCLSHTHCKGYCTSTTWFIHIDNIANQRAN